MTLWVPKNPHAQRLEPLIVGEGRCGVPQTQPSTHLAPLTQHPASCRVMWGCSGHTCFLKSTAPSHFSLLPSDYLCSSQNISLFKNREIAETFDLRNLVSFFPYLSLCPANTASNNHFPSEPQGKALRGRLLRSSLAFKVCV